ncbi:MAG TPA: hypothetical protein VIH90_08230 [Candidatus Saccharimonadales bacterium]
MSDVFTGYESGQPELRLRDVDEAVIFYSPGGNPTSSNETVERVQSRIGHRIELPGRNIPVRYLKTSADVAETEATFVEEVDPSLFTAAGYIGGDGTGRHLIQALSTLKEDSGTPSYPNTGIWAVGAGSGGNTLRSTIAPDDRLFPDYVAQNGRMDEFRPIEGTYTLPNGKSFTLYAASIIGHNATFNVISPVNHQTHRSNRIRNLHIGHRNIGKYLVDPPKMLAGLLRSRSVEFDNELDDGSVERVEALERAYINMPRIAEIIHAPGVTIEGPVHTFSAESLPAIVLEIALLKFGRSLGSDLLTPDRFTSVGELRIQVDGEDSLDDSRVPLEDVEDNDGNERKMLVLPPGTKVVIQQSDTPVKIVTTFPRALV